MFNHYTDQEVLQAFPDLKDDHFAIHDKQVIKEIK